MELDVPVLEARAKKLTPTPGQGDLQFKHSGDMGDILFSLPAIRAMGGGTLYLDIQGGASSPVVAPSLKAADRDRLKFDGDAFAFVEGLLMQQDYIKDVQVWQGIKDYGEIHDLDRFRQVIMHDAQMNIAHAHLSLFKIDDMKHLDKWLTVEGNPPPEVKGKILVSRNLRYQNSYMFWEENRKFLSENGIFVGYDIEHQAFQHALDIDIPRLEVSTATDVALAIKGCKEVWANQGGIMTIAIGMGATFVQEVFKDMPVSRFPRKNGYYV